MDSETQRESTARPAACSRLTPRSPPPPARRSLWGGWPLPLLCQTPPLSHRFFTLQAVQLTNSPFLTVMRTRSRVCREPVQLPALQERLGRSKNKREYIVGGVPDEGTGGGGRGRMRGGPARPGLPESPRASLPPHHYLHPSTLLPTPTTQRTKISKFSAGRVVRVVYRWPRRQALPARPGCRTAPPYY